ncbi:DEDD protein, partial [Nothocercus nigrocapillus]|nr:DEDD protein [Nothocercus nigrocapillus]
MAAHKRSRAQAWPEERGDREHGLYSLHRMFDIVGTHLTHRDVRVLSFLFVDVIDDYERGMIRSGRDFLLALERQGRCDETNFRQVLQLLRIITRHDLLPYVTLKRRRAGKRRPRGAAPRARALPPGSTAGARGTRGIRPACRVSPAARTSGPEQPRQLENEPGVVAGYGLTWDGFPDTAHAGHLSHWKLPAATASAAPAQPLFSELTYLDAFWRDYINGSLLEALKGVFITDSLKQAVGHEAIKLLVNVDEEDYEVGRQKLLRNLMLQTAP